LFFGVGWGWADRTNAIGQPARTVRTVPQDTADRRAGLDQEPYN